jgi:uncharacterized protein YggL (DUF469 family)
MTLRNYVKRLKLSIHELEFLAFDDEDMPEINVSEINVSEILEEVIEEVIEQELTAVNEY